MKLILENLHRAEGNDGHREVQTAAPTEGLLEGIMRRQVLQVASNDSHAQWFCPVASAVASVFSSGFSRIQLYA